MINEVNVSGKGVIGLLEFLSLMVRAMKDTGTEEELTNDSNIFAT